MQFLISSRITLKSLVLFSFLVCSFFSSKTTSAQNIPLESLTIFPAVFNDKYTYTPGTNIDPITGNITSTLTIHSNENEIEKDHFYGAVLKPDPTPFIGSKVRLSVDVLVHKLYPNRAYTGTGAHLYLRQTRDTRPGEKVTGDLDFCMLFFDNSDNRYYTTVGVPTTMTVTAPILPSIEKFQIGFWLEGAGEITFSNLRMEVVDPSTPEEKGYPFGIDPKDHIWCSTQN